MIGVSIGNSANSASPSGTSIPVKKGGTGATTPSDAMQNLLPDFSTNNGKVLGSTGSAITWVERTDARSSDDIGKVKVNDTDKTMTTNGEISTNGASQVSINRPDLWTAGVEYDFGGGLYGQRFIGSISGAAYAGINETLMSGPVSYVISSGGWWDCNRQAANQQRWIMAGQGYAVYGGSGTTGHVFTSVISVTNEGVLNFHTVSAADRTNGAPYDVWVTYKK
ncbi:MAG: hypothetical protein LBK50_03540 [Candidatus Nomurabacteria bacterium]|jgi:hypothetical protein|nr:hypothetical protein [Candidatus Nomurabacteria bacterium]